MRYTIKTWKLHLNVAEPRPSYKANGSNDIARIARALYADLDADQEHFMVFTMDNKNKITGTKVLASGSMTSSIAHPREIFKHVVVNSAAAFVAVHNHPSGDPTPSPDDNDITKRLKEGAELLGIRFLDHVIIGDGTDQHYSYLDKGAL